MAKDKTKNKNKISDYNLASILLDIVMLFLGLIFFIGTLAGKGDEIASGFVRVVGGVLILVGIFELINFVNDQSNMRISTGMLNNVLADAQARVQPPTDKFIINPLPIITIFNFVFGIIIGIYAVIIIVVSVGTLRPAGAKYWWFSLLFGIAALGMGIFVTCFNGATKTLTIIIGITLVVGAIGGIANAILASQAKKEFKANSKILEDATYTVESETTTEDKKEQADGDDTVKY